MDRPTPNCPYCKRRFEKTNARQAACPECARVKKRVYQRLYQQSLKLPAPPEGPRVPAAAVHEATLLEVAHVAHPETFAPDAPAVAPEVAPPAPVPPADEDGEESPSVTRTRLRRALSRGDSLNVDLRAARQENVRLRARVADLELQVRRSEVVPSRARAAVERHYAVPAGYDPMAQPGRAELVREVLRVRSAVGVPQMVEALTAVAWVADRWRRRLTRTAEG